MATSKISGLPYHDYKIGILEEAEEILSSKKNFIEDSKNDMSLKLAQLQEISDFFFLEGEYELSKEFNSIAKAIQIKKLLRI
jgi:hypothetical protein